MNLDCVKTSELFRDYDETLEMPKQFIGKIKTKVVFNLETKLLLSKISF